LDSEDFQDIKTKIAGYIEDFQGENYMDRKETRRYDLFTQYAYAASVQALAESGLILEKLNKDRAGIYIGSGASGLTTLLDNYKTMLEKGSKRVSPSMLPASISNISSALTAFTTGFLGPRFSSPSAS